MERNLSVIHEPLTTDHEPRTTNHDLLSHLLARFGTKHNSNSRLLNTFSCFLLHLGPLPLLLSPTGPASTHDPPSSPLIHIDKEDPTWSLLI